MFFYPWYPALMLAVESNNVIDIRLRSIATGKVNAKEETRLMVSEKIDAALEAGSMLVNGRRPAEVIDLYRKHVAANASAVLARGPTKRKARRKRRADRKYISNIGNADKGPPSACAVCPQRYIGTKHREK